jgi:hypothetical protein
MTIRINAGEQMSQKNLAKRTRIRVLLHYTIFFCVLHSCHWQKM